MSTEKTAVTYPGRLGDQYTGLGVQKSHFSVVFHEEYVTVMISDFTKHLIFREGLEDKNSEDKERRKKKTSKEKKKLYRKVFPFI